MNELVEQWAEVLMRALRLRDLLGLLVAGLPVVAAVLASFLLSPLLTPPRPAVGAEKGDARQRRSEGRAWWITGAAVLLLGGTGVAMAVVHVSAEHLLHSRGVIPAPRGRDMMILPVSVLMGAAAVLLWLLGRPGSAAVDVD